LRSWKSVVAYVALSFGTAVGGASLTAAGVSTTPGPYSAQLEQRSLRKGEGDSARESTWLWTLHRDAGGRTRAQIRLTIDGEGVEVAILMDLRMGQALVIDTATGKILSQRALARLVPLGPMRSAANSPAPPQKGSPRVEDLGIRIVENVQCRGERVTYDDGTIESWRAMNGGLDEPVFTRTMTESAQYESRLFNIRFGDPDPSLFAPLDAVR
jgi:hypothetical protein